MDIETNIEVNYLTPKELAKRWGFSEATLSYWRSSGEGPDFIRRGKRKIFYSIEEVKKYEEENPGMVL